MKSPYHARFVRTAFMMTAVAALAMPINAHQPASAHRSPAEMPSADDDGLLFNGDPVIVPGQLNPGWMEFETDPCGTLLNVGSNRSVMTQAAFSDDPEDFDDEDPADLGRELIGRWLSEHPETAVINDGVDKACQGDWFDDEELPAVFEARVILRHRGLGPSKQSASIA
jgi:hypothetical protein